MIDGRRLRRVREPVARIGLMTVGSIVAWVVAEAALRLYGWPAPGLYRDGRGPLPLRTPGRLGGAYPPGAARLRHYDYDVAWDVNAQGFRDDRLHDKTTGEWRVALLGDSFVAGVGVDRDARFGDLWRAATRDRDVSLINLGSPLCGTVCEVEAFRALDPLMDNDEIVLAFYGGNDVEENEEKPAVPASAAGPLRSWLREHSRLATFIWVNGLRWLARFRPPGVYDAAQLDRQWPATERALDELHSLAGQRPFRLIYLPAAAEWDESTWRLLCTRYGVLPSARSLVRARVEAWASAHRIPVTDVTPALSSCRTLRECAFPVDGHWNARGHRLVAEWLIERSPLRRPD